MKQCKKCGKKSLFLKLNNLGYCNNCESLAFIENREAQLNYSVNNLSQILADQQKLYNEISAKAKFDALQQLNNTVTEKQQIIEQLSNKISLEQSQLNLLHEDIEKNTKQLNSNINKLQKAKALYKSIQNGITKYFNHDVFERDIILPQLVTEADELLQPTIELKLHCMDLKQLKSQFTQNKKIIKETLLKYESRYTTKANIAIYKLMVIALEAELQNVLYNINYGKLDNAISSIKDITQKYLKIATDGNQSIAPTLVKFIAEIEGLFINAIKIEYEYYVQKERIKEEQRALREQMREEAEERKILEQQQKQIEKEEEKYNTQISSIQEQINSTSDNNRIAQLENRLQELQSLLANISKQKDEIISRQNGKAGHVYIISNIGSFGDQTYKIGMTRRLDPQERVNELGDASVPFPFDVHSFIFSEDAVGLEYKMHNMLNDRRVNKINLRKEFFNITIDELEALTQELEPSAEFNRTALAEQYYQSISMNENEII